MSVADVVLNGLETELDWVRSVYTQLHQHPELSFKEHETAGLIEHSWGRSTSGSESSRDRVVAAADHFDDRGRAR
ncbi:hypothetical protein SPF06_21840 [Sinomonas sp. JGH33]|uniref:Amidohydrolase n=1 Tax=Sinomonas terricola TaxID=3110330 RepID=A0ABU5TCG2_9MICC|nr:hypothetical protein [Sinomonas sp. JGH33]MEA5457366.1 hypothetical protein [Sinomonas sp. JGH33]